MEASGWEIADGTARVSAASASTSYTAAPNPMSPSYYGDRKDGKKNGLGTLVFPDGSKYVGHFTDDLRDGPGTYIDVAGRQFSEVWRGGNLASSAAIALNTTVTASNVSGPAPEGIKPVAGGPVDMSAQNARMAADGQVIHSSRP